MEKNENYRDVIIQEFNTLVSIDSLKARKVIKKLKYSNDAYLVRCIALTYKDEAIFDTNWKLKDVKNYDYRKLKMAKKYIDRAFNINPNCRDVLFTRGTIYSQLGDKYTAIDCFTRILELKKSKDKIVNCAEENSRYIRMVYNDTYLKLYQLFWDIGSKKTARSLLRQYKDGLKKGADTIYKPLKNFI
jgi:tetratricopeptide (TPR) repeat protein